MISYNIKFIFFSIILGILTLIYNNDYSQLYKNIHYKSFVELPNNFRTLGELLCEPPTSPIHDSNLLSEYGNKNEKTYSKNNYTNNHAKTNFKITEVTKKVNTQTTNSKKYKKENYNKDKEPKSNRSSRSIKYLEMQRKLYNNFYAKPGTDFKNMSDKSNNKFCEYENKKEWSNKVHDKYLDNLKECCVGGAGMCVVSSAGSGFAGITAAKSAGLNCVLSTQVFVVGGKVAGVNVTGLSALGEVIKAFGSSSGVVKVLAAEAIKDTAFMATFQPYAIAIYVILAIIAVIIILYIWLRRRRKYSWKHKYKKHLCR
ncbi:PIR protein,putative [Plasmodium sp.]|nr:PIR protein,putative [Plasmodium sp.]